ncbi:MULTISPECIES: hypothetical protein [Aeromonas]|uniref:hypothetical protein n=1 Tax=Aeromonas TaxID=642 RepID=UPI00100866D0|nr:hypothetical protein [Aeromonas allosaccharophila]
MSWTAERFLNELDVSMKPDCWTGLGLDSPARRFITENAMAAFEMRAQVSSCKAWRGRSIEQIDEDFMTIVVIPLVLDNPMIASNGAILSWDDGYKERRGPKRSYPHVEGDVALSFLQKRILELSCDMEKIKSLNIADDGKHRFVSELSEMRDKYKEIVLDVRRNLYFKEVERCSLVYRVSAAMQELTEVGIPCSKIDVEAFWLNLLATGWRVEPCRVYSAARKIKSYRHEKWVFPV